MKKIQSVRGTVDLFSQEMRRHNKVITEARSISSLYGYEEVSLPIMEKSEVFIRPLGLSSDVVSKETYTFDDRGGESITLRPEGTAGIIRSIISEGKMNELPLKLFYSGPMFRYERPQKGRLRQFTQVGIESIGNSDAIEDVDVISCGVSLLKKLGILDNCILNINTLGDAISRKDYRENLVKYFMKKSSKLSKLSQSRLSINPLRILDSKEEEDQEIILNAPLFSSFLNKTSIEHFEKVLKFLKLSKIEFLHNEKLVRGLDYYCHTTFEFITKDLGSQGTILGGGRYDGLSEMLNGPKMPAVGFAAGVDRLAMLYLSKLSKPVIISIVPIEKENFEFCYKLLNKIRENKICAEIYPGGNVTKNLKKISKKDSKFVIFIGENEIKNGKLILKNLSTGNQSEVSIEELYKDLKLLTKLDVNKK